MGVTGVLYRRWAFNESALDLLPDYYRAIMPEHLQPPRLHWLDENARRAIALADDVWLSTWLSRVQVPRMVVPDALQAAQGACPTLGFYFTQQSLATAARGFSPVTLSVESRHEAIGEVTTKAATEACTVGCHITAWLNLGEQNPVAHMSASNQASAAQGGSHNVFFPVSIALPASSDAAYKLPAGIDPADLISHLWERMLVDTGKGASLGSRSNKHVTLSRVRDFPVDVLDSLHGHTDFDLYNKLIVFWAMAHGEWSGRWVPNDYFREPVDMGVVTGMFAVPYEAWQVAKNKAPRQQRSGLGQPKLDANVLLDAFHAQTVPGADKRGWHWMQPNETLSSFVFLQGGDSSNMWTDLQKLSKTPAPAWWPPTAWDQPPALPGLRDDR
jgi:hypothetical protein